MSSILKALRKVEEEKRVATNAAPDLRSDQGASAPKPRPFLALLAGAFLGVVCLGLLFVFALEKSEPELVVTPQTTEEPLLQATAPAPAPQPGPQVIPVVEMPPEPVAYIPAAPKKAKKTLSFKTEPIAKSMSYAKKDKLSQEVSAIMTPQTVEPPKSDPSSLPAGVVLAVTEIYHHDKAENSMAVVNDLPVMVGTLIDSAVVAEIRPEHVVFDLDGKRYIVPKPR